MAFSKSTTAFRNATARTITSLLRVIVNVRSIYFVLSFFQSALTFNLGKAKLVGITAQYARRRRSDTVQPVHQWTVGLAPHY